MSAEVRRRLEALERDPGAGGEDLTIVVRYVRPGEPEGEALTLRSLDGAKIDRVDDESEAEFVARAAALVRGGGAGVVVLLADP